MNLKSYWPVRVTQRPRTARRPLFDGYALEKAKHAMVRKPSVFIPDDEIVEIDIDFDLAQEVRQVRATTTCTDCTCTNQGTCMCYEMNRDSTSTCTRSTYGTASGW